jgi:hypothetical protein
MPAGEWNRTFLKGGAATADEYAASRDNALAAGLLR